MEDEKPSMNFEEDVSVNRDRLDEEWLKQSTLMMRYAKLKAHAKRKWNKAIEKKKTIRSELILDAKREGGEKLLKVDKITDSVVEAYYRTHKDYIAAKDAEIEAEFNYGMLEGAIAALTDRKHELQDLVSLHQSGYWSDPREPEGSDIKKKASEVYSSKQREGLKKSMKKRG